MQITEKRQIGDIGEKASRKYLKKNKYKKSIKVVIRFSFYHYLCAYNIMYIKYSNYKNLNNKNYE